MNSIIRKPIKKLASDRKKIVCFFLLLSLSTLFLCKSNAQTTVVWTDNCNTGTGWSLSGTIPNSTGFTMNSYNWMIVTPTAPSPYENQCFYTEGNNNYISPGSDNFGVYVLTSPNIDLTSYTNCRMFFQTYLDVESPGGCGWDGTYIEYSTDGGSSWSLLSSGYLCPAYDGNITQNGANPYNPHSEEGGDCSYAIQPAWYGSWASSGWKKVSVDLSSIDGTNIRFRFILFSDEQSNGKGWAIDDIVIVNNPPDIRLYESNGTTIISNNSSFLGNSYLDFGTSSTSKDFIVSNIASNSTLNFKRIPYVQISGDPTFSVTQQPSSGSISGGSTTSFSIAFNAAGASLGKKYATVTFHTDDNYYSSCGCDSIYFLYLRAEIKNQPPVANNDTYSRFYTDSSKKFSVNAANGVLNGDTDADGNTLTAHLVSGPLYGLLTFNSDGSFDYTSNNGYLGSDSFTYQAYDGTAYSNTATVTLNVVVPHFTGAGANDNFSNNANWNCGYYPPESLNIVIDANQNMVVDQNYTCKNLQFMAGSSFNCVNGSTLSITGDVLKSTGATAIDVNSSIQVKSSIQIQNP